MTNEKEPDSRRAFVAWVVASPDDPSLAPLDTLTRNVELVIGADERAFAGSHKPDVIMFGSGRTDTFERIWDVAGGAPWVHSRFAGVEHVLFPRLVESEAVVTCGRGAFATALAEF